MLMLSIAAAIIMQTKSHEISAMSINTAVKLKFIHLSVYSFNAPPIWRQMTLVLRRFFDVMAHYIVPKSRCNLYLSVDK